MLPGSSAGSIVSRFLRFPFLSLSLFEQSIEDDRDNFCQYRCTYSAYKLWYIHLFSPFDFLYFISTLVLFFLLYFNYLIFLNFRCTILSHLISCQTCISFFQTSPASRVTHNKKTSMLIVIKVFKYINWGIYWGKMLSRIPGNRINTGFLTDLSLNL